MPGDKSGALWRDHVRNVCAYGIEVSVQGLAIGLDAHYGCTVAGALPFEQSGVVPLPGLLEKRLLGKRIFSIQQ